MDMKQPTSQPADEDVDLVGWSAAWDWGCLPLFLLLVLAAAALCRLSLLGGM